LRPQSVDGDWRGSACPSIALGHEHRKDHDPLEVYRMNESRHSQPQALVERDGHVMIITINRPEVRNAINREVSFCIGSALEEAEQDPDVRVVIITGAGDIAFSAGADLKALSSCEPVTPSDPAQRAWGFGGYATHYIGKPTIAAVNGFAYGGGTEIVLASDLAIAAENAMFSLMEVKRGLVAGGGGALRISSQLSPKVAMEILLTGDPINVMRAFELGLVNKVVPKGGALDAALELAARIAANAPLAVQASKRIARGIANGVIEHERAHWELNARETAAVRASADAREGPLAFAQKRPPAWTGT
jgi:crotonobetainyl-CoA hydratase